MRHVVIIPARNEADNISATLQSILDQTEPPDRIYVVDDGSTDATPHLVRSIATTHPSLLLMQKDDRGQRQMGGGVVDAFHFAYAACATEEFTYVSKIDADVILPTHYFQHLLTFLDRNPTVGAASGVIDERIGSRLVRLRVPRNHVPGALKTFRKHVFDEIGGFLSCLSWDIVDLVKVRSLGYQTVNLPDLAVLHLRQHGSAEGLWRGKAQWGEGAYVIGSHPLFVFARGIYRMFEHPYIIGGFAFWWGYLRAAIAGTPRIPDQALIAALRKEQLRRLAFFNRLS